MISVAQSTPRLYTHSEGGCHNEGTVLVGNHRIVDDIVKRFCHGDRIGEVHGAWNCVEHSL